MNKLAIINWLVSAYLRDPQPGYCQDIGVRVVLVPLGEFLSFLASINANIADVLKEYKGKLIEDILTPEGERLIGIREEVFAAEVIDAEEWPEYMTASDLAAGLNLPPEATRKKLERLAKKYDCFVDTDSPRSGEAKRMYRVADVLHKLKK